MTPSHMPSGQFRQTPSTLSSMIPGLGEVIVSLTQPLYPKKPKAVVSRTIETQRPSLLFGLPT